jgi:hypothetical protein
VLLPALPGRSNPASASPPATSGRSKKASKGWNPKVFFQVAAAFCFSLWAMLIVASKSIRSSVPGFAAAPACQARARAAARAARTRVRCGPSMRSSSRHAVGMLATGPNSASLSRSTSIPVTASAPSAIATARSVNTWPGRCTGNPR